MRQARPALVCGGGGALGPFQVGVLLELGASECVQYHKFRIFSGSSIGACHATKMAEHQSTLAGAQACEALWEQYVHKSSDIYRTWWPSFMGPAKYLPALWKGALFNSKPSREILKDVLDFGAVRKSGNLLRIGAIDLHTGLPVAWTEQTATWRAVAASAAFPLAFETVKIAGNRFSDWGLREVAPLQSAIDAGASSLLVVLCQPSKLEPWTKSKSVLDVGKRSIDIIMSEVIENDIAQCEHINSLVRRKHPDAKNKRYVQADVIRPPTSLGDSLDFSRESQKKRLTAGREAAKVFLEQRQGC